MLIFLLTLVIAAASKVPNWLVPKIIAIFRKKIVKKLREYMGVSHNPMLQDWWQTYKADLLCLGTGRRGPYPLRRWNECKGKIPTEPVMQELNIDLSLTEAKWEPTVGSREGPTVFVKTQVEPTTDGGTRTWWGTMQKVGWKLEALPFSLDIQVTDILLQLVEESSSALTRETRTKSRKVKAKGSTNALLGWLGKYFGDLLVKLLALNAEKFAPITISVQVTQFAPSFYNARAAKLDQT